MSSLRRFEDVAGIALMGDAVIHVIGGREHFRLWQGTTDSPYNRAIDFVAERGWVRALVSAGEFALGWALARHAEKPAGHSA